MKYLSIISIICVPVLLSGMTEEEALAEQELIAGEVQAIRAQNTNAIELCQAIKFWRETNQGRLDAVDAALATQTVESVLQPLVIPDGSSAEDAAFLTSNYQVHEAIFNLREQYKNATPVELCEAIKTWREANQSTLDALDVQATALQPELSGQLGHAYGQGREDQQAGFLSPFPAQLRHSYA